MKKQVDPNSLYDLEAVAELLDLKPRSIRAMTDRGELPKHKVGQRLMWTGSQILKSLSKGKLRVSPIKGMEKTKVQNSMAKVRSSSEPLLVIGHKVRSSSEPLDKGAEMKGAELASRCGTASYNTYKHIREERKKDKIKKEPLIKKKKIPLSQEEAEAALWKEVSKPGSEDTSGSYARVTILFNKRQLYISEWLRKKSFEENRPQGVIIRELLKREIEDEKKDRVLLPSIKRWLAEEGKRMANNENISFSQYVELLIWADHNRTYQKRKKRVRTVNSIANIEPLTIGKINKILTNAS